MHAQTRRQREVLDFIAGYIDSHGYRPSYQLIARHMGVSSRAGIARIVHDLESQGLLTRRRENGHFHIDIGKSAPRPGVAGGIAIEWLDVPDANVELTRYPVALSESLLSGYDPIAVRAYRVSDGLMADDGIYEDDIALIETESLRRDGQKVVAVIDDERSILRRYSRVGSNFELCAAGDDGEIISLAADRVVIKGVYKGLLRPMT